jgi:hypothetical protein
MCFYCSLMLHTWVHSAYNYITVNWIIALFFWLVHAQMLVAVSLSVIIIISELVRLWIKLIIFVCFWKVNLFRYFNLARKVLCTTTPCIDLAGGLAVGMLCASRGDKCDLLLKSC